MISISRASLPDLADIQQISRTTFLESFKDENAEANMKAYLDQRFSSAQLETEIKNPHSSFYLAKLGNTVIAYLKLNINEAQTEHLLTNALEIERIYILKAHQGRGLGKQLLQLAIDRAIELNKSEIWLGVWEKNHRAIAFYKKNGFQKFDQHVFMLGDDAQTDWLMKRAVSF